MLWRLTRGAAILDLGLMRGPARTMRLTTRLFFLLGLPPHPVVGLGATLVMLELGELSAIEVGVALDVDEGTSEEDGPVDDGSVTASLTIGGPGNV